MTFAIWFFWYPNYPITRPKSYYPKLPDTRILKNYTTRCPPDTRNSTKHCTRYPKNHYPNHIYISGLIYIVLAKKRSLQYWIQVHRPKYFWNLTSSWVPRRQNWKVAQPPLWFYYLFSCPWMIQIVLTMGGLDLSWRHSRGGNNFWSDWPWK